MVMVPLVLVIVWLGVFPQPVLDTTERLVNTMLQDKTSQARLATPWRPNEERISSKPGLHE
jgi:NADH:ubiquinone oxidoreductase subunit 4 (subunit M)